MDTDRAPDEFVDAELDDPSTRLVRSEDTAEFFSLLEQLPPVQRSALLLHVLEDFSLEDIAGITAVPLGTVKSRLHHAKRAKLRASQRIDRTRETLAARASPGFAGQLQRLGTEADSRYSPYSQWTLAMGAVHAAIIPPVVHKQALLELAVIACALERHHLAHGRYPEKLGDLVPAFLDRVPVDLIDGQPLRYRRDDATGRFALYSLGFDGVDDGGRPRPAPKNANRGEGGRATDPGDWVWPQPKQEMK